MLSNKTWGIAGAAMLGTAVLLGTNAASAKIDLDATDKSKAATTFAKETISDTVTGKDGVTYYKVDGGDYQLNIGGMVGVGGTSGSVLIVEFVFDGMVLTSTSAPVLTIVKSDGKCDNKTVNGDEATKRGGGGAGEDTVSFIIERSGSNDSGDTIACLQLEDAGVSMSGGGVTMNVSDNLPLPATAKKSYSGAVRIVNALEESAKMNVPKTTVASGFLSFEGDLTNAVTGDDTAQMATVGSFSAGVSGADTAPRNAQNGFPIDEKNLYASGTADENTVADNMSSVQFTGDFSFASSVTLAKGSDDSVCDNPGGDLRMAEVNGERDTTKLQAQSLAHVNANPNLCITVLAADHDDAVKIPETSPYMVTAKYAGGNVTGAMFATAGITHNLGYIDRDGTTVRFPFLSVREGYVQRIRIVNRGAPAKYTMDYSANAAALEGEDVGELMTGRTVLRVDKMVEVTDGTTTTAGTLIIEAQPHMIDIATTLNNSGAIDTVVYMEE